MEKTKKNQMSRRRKLIKKQERRRNRNQSGLNALGKEIFQGWHKVNGELIEDLEGYIYSYLSENGYDTIQLMIGTDGVSYSNRESDENTAKGIKASTLKLLSVLCFVKPGKGAHVIKRAERQTFNYRITTAEKLNAEVNKTYQLAMYLKELNVKFEVHLDLNPNQNYESFNVYNTIKGFFESLDIPTSYKPDSPAASAAADYYI